MGQKSNPIILRLNKTNQHWNSCWYSDSDYATPFLQDYKINVYVNSSQQQLGRFPPVSFVKRQRGDLQIALFSAKPAQQFSKFKHNKYKNFTSHFITHNIFKKWASYEGQTHKDDTPHHVLTNRVDRPSPAKLMGPPLTPTPAALGKKKEYFRSQLFLAIISGSNALKAALDVLPKKTPHPLAGKLSTRLANSGAVNKRGGVKIVDFTKTHLEYSIYRYYNEYKVPFAPVRSKLYLIKSPSIFQNPLFLASQVVSLLEERAVFRQIKHRVVREIQKNPTIRGVRIICSGRVASRSKKAQKARRESVQWGATSLNVFSEHVNFASCFAQTTFGKIGVKVWISYNFKAC